jgi:hypothetical protein
MSDAVRKYLLCEEIKGPKIMVLSRNTENSRKITNFLLSFSIFILSLIVGPLYVEGDQAVYRPIYEGLESLNLTEGYLFYIQKISSLEYGHYLFSWLASKFLHKDIFIALANTILAFSLIILLRKWRVSFLVICLLLLTNYYMFGLYFAAERLKFGILFLFLSLVYIERVKLFYLFAFLAVTTHIQLIIVYGSILFFIYTKSIFYFLKSGRISGRNIIIFLFVIIIFELMAEQILRKYSAYNVDRDVTNLVRIFIFFALALWYSKRRSETVLLFFPLILAVQLVGGDRVNMFGYFFFLYYALRVRRGLNAGVLFTSIYFIYASFGFLYGIINFGDGFAKS